MAGMTGILRLDDEEPSPFAGANRPTLVTMDLFKGYDACLIRLTGTFDVAEHPAQRVLTRIESGGDIGPVSLLIGRLLARAIVVHAAWIHRQDVPEELEGAIAETVRSLFWDGLVEPLSAPIARARRQLRVAASESVISADEPPEPVVSVPVITEAVRGAAPVAHHPNLAMTRVQFLALASRMPEWPRYHFGKAPTNPRYSVN